MCDGKSNGVKRIGSVVYDVCEKCGKPIRGTGKTAGGVAIFVTKDYVKKGQRVPFSDRWLALCESVGFILVCRHQAMLVEHHGWQMTTGGGIEEINTERKSFFRRLAEKKGSPRIDHEDVLCFVK